MMKCKNCNVSGGSVDLSKHYKEYPDHRPGKKLGHPISVKKQTVEDKIKILHEELQVTLQDNQTTIEGFKTEIKRLEKENERLRQLSRQIDPNITREMPISMER